MAISGRRFQDGQVRGLDLQTRPREERSAASVGSTGGGIEYEPLNAIMPENCGSLKEKSLIDRSQVAGVARLVKNIAKKFRAFAAVGRRPLVSSFRRVL
jgi:hypothetical protein